MPYLVSIVVALWLGSLAHLILSIATLFSTFPKFQSFVAIEAAPAIFAVTDRYNLALAIASVVLTVIWRLTSRVRLLNWTAALLTLATVLALLQIAVISPRMQAIRPHENVTRTPQQIAMFDRLHHLSSIEYTAQTLMVLTAALLLPAAIRQATRDRAPESPVA